MSGCQHIPLIQHGMQLLAVVPKIYVGKIQGVCNFNNGLVFFPRFEKFQNALLINGRSITTLQDGHKRCRYHFWLIIALRNKIKAAVIKRVLHCKYLYERTNAEWTVY